MREQRLGHGRTLWGEIAETRPWQHPFPGVLTGSVPQALTFIIFICFTASISAYMAAALLEFFITLAFLFLYATQYYRRFERLNWPCLVRVPASPSPGPFQPFPGLASPSPGSVWCPLPPSQLGCVLCCFDPHSLHSITFLLSALLLIQGPATPPSPGPAPLSC